MWVLKRTISMKPADLDVHYFHKGINLGSEEQGLMFKEMFWISACKGFAKISVIKSYRPLDKSVYRKNNFLISQPKHMLWVLKRTVSMRRFF